MSRLLKTYKNKVSQIFKAGIHNGIDIIGHNGLNNGSGYCDYLLAHSDGVVVGARNDIPGFLKGSYGNYVKIKHDNGMYTLYAHIKYKTVTVKTGDRVTKGQVIGYMGNTGNSFGAHLHFEVRNEKDAKIDPTPYIDADLPIAEKKGYTGTYPTLPSRGYFYYDSKHKKVVDKGEQVKNLQRLLNWILGINLAIDGYCGPATSNAILQFQKTYNLKTDSCFGKECLAKAKTIVK